MLFRSVTNGNVVTTGTTATIAGLQITNGALPSLPTLGVIGAATFGANVDVTGVEATGYVGTVTVAAKAVVNVSGVEAQTYLGTAEVVGAANVYPTVFGVALSGVNIKLADVNINSLNIDIDNIKKSYSKDVKAILIVHLYGNPVDITWRLQDTTQLTFDEIKFDKWLRLLHIDGCHEHSAVLSDLQLFNSFMADNGVIVVDDFNDQEYPGVKSAVIEFCLSKVNYKNWKIIAIGDNKAYIVQKKFQEQLRRMARDAQDAKNT